MPQKDRVIFHADMNAYFASVEELYHPRLREVPMAICGNPESRRGIIVAKNERAKKCGVKTAETIYRALQKCPDLVLRPTRRYAYNEFCHLANEIYGNYTDLVEQASIDESYLDVTGSLGLFGMDAEALANDLRERVQRELGLTISVGVSYNKVFAKMASDLKKPNAVTVVSRENYQEKLWPLPIGTLLMVGKSAEAALLAMGIETIGALARTDIQVLRGQLGKLGEHLYISANGLDASPVLSIEDTQEVQSIGNGITFKRDLLSRQDITTAINALSDTVATRLRKEALKCQTVQVTIKDPDFKVITRQKGLPAPTWLAADLAKGCMELIEASWKIGKPIRLLTVTAMKLVHKEEALEQLTLFAAQEDEGRKKREKLEQTMDRLRDRYGSGIITTLGIAHNDLGIHEDYGVEDEDD